SGSDRHSEAAFQALRETPPPARTRPLASAAPLGASAAPRRRRARPAIPRCARGRRAREGWPPGRITTISSTSSRRAGCPGGKSGWSDSGKSAACLIASGSSTRVTIPDELPTRQGGGLRVGGLWLALVAIAQMAQHVCDVGKLLL